MRFLCIGDLHIKVENIETVDRIEEQVCAWLEANRERLDAVVILGDVLHTHERLHVLALNRAYRFFSRVVEVSDRPLYVLVGNHDFIQNDQFLTSNHWMNAVKRWPNTFIVDRVLSMERHGETALFCPYVPNGRFEEALFTEPDWRRAAVIFAHQEFRGAAMNNGIVSFSGDEWNSDRPFVVSGHIHGRQDLECGVHYVGASLPSADGKSNLSLVKTRPRKVTPIPLAFPRRRVLRNLTLEQVRSEYSEWNLADIHGLVIKDTFDNFKLFQKEGMYKELIARQIKVDFKPQDEAKSAETSAAPCGFYEYLVSQVLKQESEFLYAALERVVHDTVLEEDDILVVNRRFGLE